MFSKKAKRITISIIIILVLCVVSIKLVFIPHINRTLCQSISFVDSNYPGYVVHPFLSDGNFVVVLPNGWDEHNLLTATIKTPPENSIPQNQHSLSNKTISNVWTKCDVSIGELQRYKVIIGCGLSLPINVIIYKSHIKTICIETDSGTIDEINASKDKSYGEGGFILAFGKGGNVVCNDRLKRIRGHGNSSWQSAVKKSYNIKLEHKAPLCTDLPEKSFSLISNSADPSGLENWISYRLCDLVNMPYRINYDYCQLFLNGHYNGLYLICNKVKVDPDHLNINDLERETQDCNDIPLNHYNMTTILKDSLLVNTNGFNIYRQGFEGVSNPSNITGGYILESHSRLGNDVGSFITKRNVRKSLKFPESPSIEQVEYIQNYYDEFEDALVSKDGFNPQFHRYYTEYIDLNSFAKYYLVQEFLLNQDAELASFFIYKDIDTIDNKLYAGPIWDMDALRSGKSHNIPSCYALKAGIISPDGSLSASFRSQNYKGLFYSLLCHKEFCEEVFNVYSKDFEPAIERLFTHELDSLISTISNDWMVNSLKWDNPFTLLDYSRDYQDFYLKRKDFLSHDLRLPKGEYYTVVMDFNEGMSTYSYHLLEFHVNKGERLQVPSLNIDEQITDNKTIVIKPLVKENGLKSKIKEKIKGFIN